jgi:hypothetical protein
MPPVVHGVKARRHADEQTYDSGVIEPKVRGELGYMDWCLILVDAGHCSCDGCGGHLVDGRCLSCGCGHKISEPSRFDRRRGVAWFPVYPAGRCAHADAVRAQDEQQHERQARRRRTAEELGDPRR